MTLFFTKYLFLHRFISRISLLSISLLTAISLIPLFTQAAVKAEIVKMDRIIAVVDQSVITEQELADRIKSVTAQLEKQGTNLPPENVLEKQIAVAGYL